VLTRDAQRKISCAVCRCFSRRDALPAPARTRRRLPHTNEHHTLRRHGSHAHRKETYAAQSVPRQPARFMPPTPRESAARPRAQKALRDAPARRYENTATPWRTGRKAKIFCLPPCAPARYARAPLRLMHRRVRHAWGYYAPHDAPARCCLLMFSERRLAAAGCGARRCYAVFAVCWRVFLRHRPATVRASTMLRRRAPRRMPVLRR